MRALLTERLDHSDRMGRSPKTLHEYKRKVDRDIRPTLGAVSLDKLTAHDLDRLYADQLASGLSPSTVLYHHRIISAALKQGRKWGWVDRNVAEDATPPSARRVEPNVPSPVQVRALILETGRSGARNPELATIVTLAALTGMRRGDFVVSVGAMSRSTQMAVLRGRHARTQIDATGATVDLSPEGYVFSADPDGARPLHPDSLTQSFERLCRRMEEPALSQLRKTKPTSTSSDLPLEDRWPFRLHDFRHYTATQLFADGMNPKTVVELLVTEGTAGLRVLAHFRVRVTDWEVARSAEYQLSS